MGVSVDDKSGAVSTDFYAVDAVVVGLFGVEDEGTGAADIAGAGVGQAVAVVCSERTAVTFGSAGTRDRAIVKIVVMSNKMDAIFVVIRPGSRVMM